MMLVGILALFQDLGFRPWTTLCFAIGVLLAQYGRGLP